MRWASIIVSLLLKSLTVTAIAPVVSVVVVVVILSVVSCPIAALPANNGSASRASAINEDRKNPGLLISPPFPIHEASLAERSACHLILLKLLTLELSHNTISTNRTLFNQAISFRFHDPILQGKCQK